METMNLSIAKTLLVASIAVLAMTANAQTAAPAAPAAPPAADKKASAESDAKAYKEGRIACKKLTGAERNECRKKLMAKYVDKQCGNLSGDQLGACLEGEYPGE
jgi:hypothetical protein